MSMDTNGKIIWAKHSEVQQANLKAMGDTEIKDGERLPLAVKDMGSCEIYPQTIQHNPNGRSVRTALESDVNLNKRLAQQLHVSVCVPHVLKASKLFSNVWGNMIFIQTLHLLKIWIFYGASL